MTKPACATCWFFVARDRRHGECRRYPPAVLAGPPPEFKPKTRFCLVNADHWCGEHATEEEGP